MVATHNGLYRLTLDGDAAGQLIGPVGGHVFDPMGLTVVGGVAYASGHPGPNSPETFGSPNLGLIRSDDEGESWSNVSLRGHTDFHSLTGASDGTTTHLFGLPADGTPLQISSDAGTTWRDGANLAARDVEASDGALYATTADGLMVSRDGGATFTREKNAPRLHLIAAAEGRGMAGVDVDGVIWTRPSGGDWIRGGRASGTPVALAFDGVLVFVADDRGIAFTEDGGAHWTTP